MNWWENRVGIYTKYEEKNKRKTDKQIQIKERGGEEKFIGYEKEKEKK